jgi:hypothetical protein
MNTKMPDSITEQLVVRRNRVIARPRYASPERIRLGVDQFLAGNTLTFHGVNFYRPSPSKLSVDSFSGWLPEHTTEAHAREKIERSKRVLEELQYQSAEFKAAVAGSELEFVCCHNYGMGSVALARVVQGRFEWRRNWVKRIGAARCSLTSGSRLCVRE